MAQGSAYDALEFEKLEFPYNRIIGELDITPRLVRGLNTYVTAGGKLNKRPGTQFQTGSAFDFSCHKSVVLETLDSPARVYIVGSFLNPGTGLFEIWWLYLSAVTPTWTKADDLRDVNKSGYPHEMIVYNGKVYIKGFPNVSGDKLGCVVFSADAGVITWDYWGILGPLVPAAVKDPVSWTAQVNAHEYVVNQGWKYSYTWVTRTGQISCRAPLETNPDKDPSDTGPLTYLAGAGHCPELVVQGVANPTLVPFINIYRSTDGGGTFYFLKQIANPGAGNVTFVDKYLESGAGGGTFSDPFADEALDTLNIAPSEESNLPPPAQRPPKEIGVDPVERSSPMAVYSSRIWFGVGNYLFYSAQEEIGEGNPQECFPGGLTGNQFQLPHGITQLISTTDALYVMTSRMTYRISGTDKDTFNPRPFLNDIGAPNGQPRSATPVGEKVAFLTHDYRIGMIDGGQFVIVSDPLFTDLIDAVAGLGQIELTHWSELDKDYLVVASHRVDDTANSRQWVCDLKRTQGVNGFWFVPWSIPATALLSSRLTDTSANRRLGFYSWDGAHTVITFLDATGRTPTDYTFADGDKGFTWFFDTHLMTVPPGNHVNSINAPARTPVVSSVRYETTVFKGQPPPRVYAYFDDFWTSPVDLADPYEPPRRNQSIAYDTWEQNVQQVCYRFGLKFQQVDDPFRFEMHNLAVKFEPGGGT
jgi:hypothetical protein